MWFLLKRALANNSYETAPKGLTERANQGCHPGSQELETLIGTVGRGSERNPHFANRDGPNCPSRSGARRPRGIERPRWAPNQEAGGSSAAGISEAAES